MKSVTVKTLAIASLGLVPAIVDAQVNSGAGGSSLQSSAPNASAAPIVRGETLVPAAMGIRTDQQGNSWNIENNGTLGRVGSSMINSGVSLLINNQQFYTYQPMMTKDGSEFVLQGRQAPTLQGLQMMRRIKVLEKEGAIRYLEIITNATPNPANITLSLRSSFSGNFKSYLTDQGNTGVVMLGERESAVLVTPGSSQSNRAFLFSLTSAKSALKPTIASQNRYGLTFQYNLAIPAGQTVVLAHAVAQVPVPQAFDRKSLAKVFKPLAMERLMSSIPSEFRKLVVNFQSDGATGGASSLSSTSVDALGVERGRRDVLALGGETRLIGTASCAELKFTTQHGEAVIPFENVAAIVGRKGGVRDVARVFLKDGQVFSGEGDATDLKFVMASGGKMNLNLRSLDRLVRAVDEKDESWGVDVSAMIETYAGDRIAVTSADAVQMSGQTPWGPLNFSLEEVVWLASLEDEPVGHTIEFKEGSRCFAFLAGAPLVVNSGIFGEQNLDVAGIRAVVTREAHERAEKAASGYGDGDPVILQPYLTTVGNQRIVGPIADAKLTILTNSQTIEVAPEEVRKLANTGIPDGGTTPVFQLELWGGGVLSGVLANDTISIQVRGKEWHVPVRDIAELITPVPQLAAEAEQSIGKLIRTLGDEKWQTREAATEELAGFGYLAKSVLEEQLRTNPDPEVRRRIERILQVME
ncbi:MAG: HEAT repeat domain-containing protein [Verrucomicrobiales bacterium]